VAASNVKHAFLSFLKEGVSCSNMMKSDEEILRKIIAEDILGLLSPKRKVPRVITDITEIYEKEGLDCTKMIKLADKIWNIFYWKISYPICWSLKNK
jgi:hypothetical protein